ncbi:uncharacterized protein LOC132044373 isoform X2 [Lycium ferocissimum]|uniref:uncharacterized protein LOC132044373 isoform X2 n=1 Tax=Lycium ferocissimum TaxID=112874 RepID=UPI002815BEAC|nr:uncharacterized protein LOC132044373 isoform X2 [Lycium ferocissimum]
MSQLQTRSEKFNKKKVSVYDLCRFDVNLQDASGSIIGIIMDKEAEKLLSLTTDEIYDLASNEDNLFLQSLLRFAEQSSFVGKSILF